jgi:hypothetical protein
MTTASSTRVFHDGTRPLTALRTGAPVLIASDVDGTLGFTAIATRPDWVDVTVRNVSKVLHFRRQEPRRAMRQRKTPW